MNKIVKSIIALSILVSSFISFGQQTDNWYFGSAAGFPNTGLRVDFSSGGPVVSTCYPLMTEEGSSSISDASGNPLFYTDGVSIWDASTNTTFGTGLNGGSSSTQSAIVMPKPGATNEWLLFTSGVLSNPGTYYYTVSGTPGAFSISGATQLVPAGTVGEGLFVIGSTKPGTDFWVITRETDAVGAVRAFEVFSTGVVNTTPVISNLSGPAFTNTSYTAKIGTIKSNTCQNQLAFTYLNGDVDLVDFNAATGQVVANTARRINVASTGGNSGSYGIEFSPNDLYLYITNLSGGRLYRHDIVGNSTSIFGTVAAGNEAGQLQAGPDGNIYMANRNASPSNPPSYLGQISNPGLPGASFNATAVLLTGVTCGGNTGFVYRGLPTFPKSLVVNNPVMSPGDGSYCVSTSIPLSYSFGGFVNTATISWTATGGGQTFTPGGATSTSPTPSVSFSTTGAKEVIVEFDDACGRTYSDTIDLTIQNPFNPSGTITCSSTDITLLGNPGDPNRFDYVWYDAASGGNVVGVGESVTLEYLNDTYAPSSFWVEVGTGVSVSSSGMGQSIGMAPGSLTWAANGSNYGPVPFTVIADRLTLQSFVVKSWNTTGTFDVEIRDGSSTLVYQNTYDITAANTPFTVDIGQEFVQGNYTVRLTNNSHQWYGGSWAGGTNAGEITLSTFGGPGTFSLANMVYDFENYTYSSTCSNRIQVDRNCSLPVELLSLSASYINTNSVKVDWSTSLEINNNYFEVQRSADGKTFETIGFVNGNGTTDQLSVYSFIDDDPLPGTAYYRLNQVDYDGNAALSRMVAVQSGQTTDPTIYPNPSNTDFTLSITGSVGAQVVVYDMLGKMVEKITAETNEIRFGGNYPVGVYVVKAINNNGLEYHMKVIKE